MGPSPTYHPPEGEKCETSVEHGLPPWADPAVGYCSRRPRCSPVRESCFVGARAVGPWVGEQKPLGKTPQWGNPSPESTYLPTSMCDSIWAARDMSSCTTGLRRRMDSILFISSSKRVGALATPKGMTFHLNTLP